jgi:hypothetical protein
MVPDFIKLADAYGALGIRVRTKEEVEPAIKLAMETKPISQGDSGAEALPDEVPVTIDALLKGDK